MNHADEKDEKTKKLRMSKPCKLLFSTSNFTFSTLQGLDILNILGIFFPPTLQQGLENPI